MSQQSGCAEETTVDVSIRQVINKLRIPKPFKIEHFLKLLAGVVALLNARDLSWSSCRGNHVEKGQPLLAGMKEFIRQILLDSKVA